MDRAICVYADLAGVPHFVGRLWTREGREGAVSQWRIAARHAGIKKEDQDRVASAFGAGNS